jgi:hypothetical protein
MSQLLKALVTVLYLQEPCGPSLAQLEVNSIELKGFKRVSVLVQHSCQLFASVHEAFQLQCMQSSDR